MMGPTEQHIRPKQVGSPGERGVALLIAIMVVAMITIFSTDLIINSQINLEQAVSGRDTLKAEYNAKSGLNLGLFLILVDLALDKFLSGPASPIPQKANDAIGDIWTVLNGMPIGSDTAELMDGMKEQFGLNALRDEKLLGQIKEIEGSITTTVEDESSKINVNFLAQGRGSEVVSMLESLFSCAAEKDFLQSKKINPVELSYRIKDWVDSNKDAEAQAGYADEDELYQRRVPPYRAQNAPFDSVEGLRMIDGWDDEMHAVFSPYITVFPLQKLSQDKPKMNINTMPRALLNCFFPRGRIECKDSFYEIMGLRDEDQSALVSEPREIADMLQRSFCYKPDASKKETWFTNTTNTFRITAEGSVGNYSKKLIVIVERKIPGASGSTPSATGAGGAMPIVADPSQDLPANILYWQMN